MSALRVHGFSIFGPCTQDFTLSAWEMQKAG